MAGSAEEAVTMLLADEEVKGHVASEHPEMAGKTPEELARIVSGMVVEETTQTSGTGGADGGMAAV